MRTTTLLIALAGCLSTPIDNPTGDCEADGDGGRACYHSPEAGDTWLPDCDAPLDRELWRVFARSEDSAYVIPRPDAAGLDTGICDGEDAALAALFAASGLCEEVADPDVVNDLDPADALTITHALHERLVFAAADQGGSWAIVPWAPDEDMVAACEGPLAGEAAVAEACTALADRVGGDECLEVAMTWTEDQARAFADGLNAVYGVATE